MTSKNPKHVNIRRHASLCGICAHPQRREIEREFLSWGSPVKIASEYNLANRATIYRHAHAFNLFPVRDRNVQAALARIIEQVDEVPVKNSSAIIQAIYAYVKITAGRNLDEHVEMNERDELFRCMSVEECDAYAKDGTLPSWYKQTKADADGCEGGQDA